MSNGMFIVLEGTECCGKSTALNKVEEKLRKLGYHVVMTREPGGTPIAEDIRKIILNKYGEKMLDETEALLFAAARAQHTLGKIQPAVQNGCIVISDRWLGSSLAYQGFTRGLGVDKVADINDFALNGFRPDLEFFIDTPLDTCLERLKKRSSLDRIEEEDVTFHQQVHDYFAQNKNMIRIDGTKDPDQLANDIVITIVRSMYNNV